MDKNQYKMLMVDIGFVTLVLFLLWFFDIIGLFFTENSPESIGLYYGVNDGLSAGFKMGLIGTIWFFFMYLIKKPSTTSKAAQA